MIKRFDLVQLRSTSRVVYLSGPPSRVTSPHGNWIVTAGVAGTNLLMCCKEGTTIQIPVEDVVRVAEYDLETGLRTLSKIKNKQDLERLRRKRNG